MASHFAYIRALWLARNKYTINEINDINFFYSFYWNNECDKIKRTAGWITTVYDEVSLKMIKKYIDSSNRGKRTQCLSWIPQIWKKLNFKWLFKQSRLEYIYSKTANTYKTPTKPWKYCRLISDLKHLYRQMNLPNEPVMTPAHLNHSFIDLFLCALKETGSFTKSLHASLKSAEPTKNPIKFKTILLLKSWILMRIRESPMLWHLAFGIWHLAFFKLHNAN